MLAILRDLHECRDSHVFTDQSYISRSAASSKSSDFDKPFGIFQSFLLLSGFTHVFSSGRGEGVEVYPKKPKYHD
jgi:hypothetical protein